MSTMGTPYQYTYHRDPFAHQRHWFEFSRDRTAFALFMEQGTGKTKVVLDTAAYLHDTFRIDGLIIVADNELHRNWITDEVPVDLPERCNASSLVWETSKASTQKFQRAFQTLASHEGLAIFAINIDAVITKNGSRAIRAFLNHREGVMMVVDESSSIKTPKAKRTRACLQLGQAAQYRRICNGTPTADGDPFAYYSQFGFLDKSIIDIYSFTAFKHEFGVWEKGTVSDGKGGLRQYPILLEYRNLDRLMNKVEEHSCRVLKEDCLDLPEKLYQKCYFKLGKDQQRLYDKLRRDFILEIAGADERRVSMVISRMLRLQQIACGYLPNFIDDTSVVDPEEPAQYLPTNARLDAFAELVKTIPDTTQVIVWARFRPDVTQLVNFLNEDKERAVRYDGAVPTKNRAENKSLFKSGQRQFFVGNPKAGGKGLTLNEASIVVYYSNYFDLEPRIQSEDRAHRIGQTANVTYIDMVGLNTIDETIIGALRDKKEISNLITGDPTHSWL